MLARFTMLTWAVGINAAATIAILGVLLRGHGPYCDMTTSGWEAMKFLTDEQLRELQPAETSSFPSPVPTQIVSSDEYMPVPQTEKQREVEARLKELSDRLAQRQGLSRRRFFQTASGMAASFLVMNQVFGRLFEVSEAEAATPDMAAERAGACRSSSSSTATPISCATTRG